MGLVTQRVPRSTDVRFWHKADITTLLNMSAFGGKADIAQTNPLTV
jgi:hypothetical protein